MLTLSRCFPLRRLALAGSLVAAFSLCVAVGAARAADQRLTDAQVALIKAAALVEAAESGVDDPKTVIRFERDRKRALRNIERAMDAIEDSKQTVDE